MDTLEFGWKPVLSIWWSMVWWWLVINGALAALFVFLTTSDEREGLGRRLLEYEALEGGIGS